MAAMGAEVHSVEVVEEFALAAESLLSALGHAVPIRVGDGSRGWAEHAPFDAILLTAAAPEPPPALLEQLRAGGRMVVPVGGKDVQQLCIVEKGPGGEISTRPVMAVRFTQLEVAG